MSIIIKRKPKYNKKKLLLRIVVLTLIYFVSFFLLYAFFGKKEEQMADVPLAEQIKYENEGEKMLAEGNYTQAIEYYLAAFSKNPEDAASLNRLAQAYYKLGQTDKAKFYFYKSRELAPNYADNYVQVATIYIESEEYLTAENVIDLMPLKTKYDFIAKGKILIKLARAEVSLEDRIIHYTQALSYFKKYDKDLYANNIKRFIDAYFELADYYASTNNIKEAQRTYRNILKYQDDCDVNNRLAFAYREISDDLVLWYIKKAVNLAKTQEEKRTTKQNLIALRNYYEKQDKMDNALIIKDFMEKLDESKILVDEKYTRIAVVDESFDFVVEKDATYPEIIFSLKNQSANSVSPIYAKAEIFYTSNPGRIIETFNKTLVLRDVPLTSGEKSVPFTMRLNKNITPEKSDKITVALSLSTNGKNWMLYRLFKKEQ